MNHPVANTVSAVTAPTVVVAAMAHFPEIITAATASLGFIWYMIVLTKEIISWFRKKDTEE